MYSINVVRAFVCGAIYPFTSSPGVERWNICWMGYFSVSWIVAILKAQAAVYPCPSGYVCSALSGGIPAEFTGSDVLPQSPLPAVFVDAFSNLTAPFQPTLKDTLQLYTNPSKFTSVDPDVCDCHDSTIEWRSLRLPSDSSFARLITPNASSRCDFLSVGFGWSVAGYATDPIVLTIPPGRFREASKAPHPFQRCKPLLRFTPPFVPGLFTLPFPPPLRCADQKVWRQWHSNTPWLIAKQRQVWHHLPRSHRGLHIERLAPSVVVPRLIVLFRLVRQQHHSPFPASPCSAPCHR